MPKLRVTSDDWNRRRAIRPRVFGGPTTKRRDDGQRLARRLRRKGFATARQQRKDRQQGHRAVTA